MSIHRNSSDSQSHAHLAEEFVDFAFDIWLYPAMRTDKLLVCNGRNQCVMKVRHEPLSSLLD